MYSDKRNKAEFDRLQAFANSFPNGVLTPLLLKNWDEVLHTSGLAWEYCLESMGGIPNSEYKPMPAVLEAILPRPLMQHSCPDALKVWSNIENFLHEKGLRSEDLEYYDCGREAIVFKIKNVPDVLLKIGVFQDLPQTRMQLSTLKRHVENKMEEGSRSDSLYVSVTPYLGQEFMEAQDADKYKDPALLNIQLDEKVIKKCNNIKLTPDRIAQILKGDGISFDDRKVTNLRAHSSLPDFFFITDRRAIGKDNKTRPKDLTAEDQEVLEAAQAIQQNLQFALKMKYGFDEAIFEGLANKAHGKPIKSNYDPNFPSDTSRWNFRQR